MNIVKRIAVILSALTLASCAQVFDKHIEWEYQQPEEFPVITAVGYAPIQTQRGNDKTQKMLMALKASKLDAYRELAEQVYGQKIDSNTSVSDMVLNNERMRSSVNGLVRGAKVVKSYSLDDTYVTEIELDFKLVHDLYLSTAKPKRIKDVIYY